MNCLLKNSKEMIKIFEIYLLEKPSLKTAISSMYMSKGNEQEIINDIKNDNPIVTKERMKALKKWGIENKHYKLIESINFSFLVKGLSRGTYDDLRTHGTFSTFVAKSTRYCDKFEIAPWFKENLIEEDVSFLERVVYDTKGLGYKSDVKRGHYPLAIETPFTIKTNLHHFMHILSQRGPNSHAHPELHILMKEMIEELNTFNPECVFVYEVLLEQLGDD